MNSKSQQTGHPHIAKKKGKERAKRGALLLSVGGSLFETSSFRPKGEFFFQGKVAAVPPKEKRTQVPSSEPCFLEQVFEE
jgi:hypothetical protein